MSTAAPHLPRPPRATPSDRALKAGTLAGVALLVALTVAGLTWAKWEPYVERTRAIAASDAYPGSDLLAKAGSPGSSPSLQGAWDFLVAYGTAIWPALVVAIVLGAGIEALLPRRWLVRVLGAGGPRGAAAGGLGALPTMMCTCCAAPVAGSLRRRGASDAAALAFWVGNPLLNPAVLVFLALLLPWPWVVTRVVVGAAVVFGASVLVARLAGRNGSGGTSRPATPGAGVRTTGHRDADDARPARRFARAVVRYVVLLVPEYAVLVVLLGLFRGWLFPVGGVLDDPAALVVVAAAVLGTLVVLPTGGEIPVLLTLATAGASTAVLGALLIVLPAVSAVSMVLVARVLGARKTLAMGGAVAASGLGGAVLLVALGG